MFILLLLLLLFFWRYIIGEMGTWNRKHNNSVSMNRRTIMTRRNCGRKRNGSKKKENRSLGRSLQYFTIMLPQG